MRVLLPYQHGLCLGQLGPFSAAMFPRVYLSPHEREKHLYVLGITGKGKSKFLEHLIVQDIVAGHGCGVIDPHSDLARNVFGHLVTNGYLASLPHMRRLLYLDMTDSEHLPAFNVLAVPGEPYAIAQLVIEAFRRTWPEALKEAPQFSNVMLAALVVLIKTKHTLVQIHRLLVDKPWRDERLAEADDAEAEAFFRDRYEKWGRDAPGMIESTLNKVSAFTFNPTLKRMLGARENALDFRVLMDERKILLCDLGGEPETRRLLGSLLVTFLEYAAFTRRDIPAQQRTPFYLYMDEFQDFSANDGSAKSLAQILSEARKFGLHLTLAHQSLSQLQTRLAGAIGNIQTKVLFGMSRQDAEIFGRALGQVDNRAVKDSPKTTTQHPLYESLPEQWEQWVSSLQWQPARRAHLVDHMGQTRQMLTLPLPLITSPPAQIAETKEQVMNNIISAAAQVHDVVSAPALSLEHAEYVSDD
ncbi:MAG: type IV secretion system DNA-binding domain-containing protein [Chloroflexota bacterium]